MPDPTPNRGIDSDWLARRHGIEAPPSSPPSSPSQAPSVPSSREAVSPEIPIDGKPGLESAHIGARGSAAPTTPGGMAAAPKGKEGDKAGKGKQEGESSEVDKEALRAKIVVRDLEPVSFDDIKGQDRAVAEIREVGDMLSFDSFYKMHGSELPRGVILLGPPGTGKTMLGIALANSGQTAFLSADCSNVMSKWLGEPEKTVSAIFDIAEEEAARHPNGHAILFLDEVDALLRSRSLDSHEASEKVLSIFLQRLNGLKKAGKVTVICATNRPDKLDAAFMSRMNAVIEVPLPDAEGRAAILKARLEKRESSAKKAFPDFEITLLGEIDYQGLSLLMVGDKGQNVMSGRELDNLANEIVTRRSAAALEAYRADVRSGKVAEAAPAERGKIQVPPEVVLEYVKRGGPILTREVLAVAMDYDKTSFMFEKALGVDKYLEFMEAAKAAQAEIHAAVQLPSPAPVYSPDGKSREEARHELIHLLKQRMEGEDRELLSDLYVENNAMPTQIRSLVASFCKNELAKDEAFRLLDEMLGDETIEPPHLKRVGAAENELPPPQDAPPQDSAAGSDSSL